MAKLPDGMKMIRGTYSTSYNYKGASIRKSRDNYCTPIEYLSSETGRVGVGDKYLSYKLQETAGRLEDLLSDTNYYLDSVGVFRLTETYKAELREQASKRIDAEIKAVESSLAQYVADKNWNYVEQMAQRLQKLENHWTRIEKVVA